MKRKIKNIKKLQDMRFALFGATGQTGSAFLRQELVKKWMCNLNVNMSVYLGPYITEF